MYFKMSTYSDCVKLNDDMYCRKSMIAETNNPCDALNWSEYADHTQYIPDLNICVGKIDLPTNKKSCESLYSMYNITNEANILSSKIPNTCIISEELDIVYEKQNVSNKSVKNTQSNPPDYKKTEWTSGSRECVSIDGGRPCVYDKHCTSENDHPCLEQEAIRKCERMDGCSYLYKKFVDDKTYYYFRKEEDKWVHDDTGETKYIPNK